MSKVLNLFLILFVAGSIAGTNLAFAEPNTCTFDNQNSNSEGNVNLCNPVQGADDVKELIIKLTKYLMGIIALVAIVVIVIGGFRMVISAGNESQIKAARSTITWAIIGLVISLLAYTIVAIIQGAFKAP